MVKCSERRTAGESALQRNEPFEIYDRNWNFKRIAALRKKGQIKKLTFDNTLMQA